MLSVLLNVTLTSKSALTTTSSNTSSLLQNGSQGKDKSKACLELFMHWSFLGFSFFN